MKYLSRRDSRFAELVGIALIGISATATTAYGQAFVEPESQPTLRAAPYVLENTNLERGPTKAYRPWFENGAWMGDLIQYTISQDGKRCTSVDVGAYPADDIANIDICPPGNWSARGKFPEKVPARNSDLLVDHPDSAQYWKDRNLFVHKPLAAGGKDSFVWNKLTPEQRHAIDPLNCVLVDGQCTSTAVDHTNPYASSMLNYLRGDRSLERDKAGGVFRLRFSLLGAIINSRPVYVRKDAGGGTVIAGANDGVLHAFDATTGQELFGYIPSMVIPKLGKLSNIIYRHTHFVDGELRHRRISTGAGKDIVVGGLGAGGKGLFGLDVTLPANPTVLFELSGTQGGHIAGTYYGYLGHIHGRPSIARLPDGAWYVVAGNGYLSGAGAQLVLIPLEGGAAIPLPIVADATADNGLSAPALVDVSGNGRVDYAYAGDLKGNLWRFDLNTKGTPVKLFSAGTSKPITVEPDIARHPTGNGIMVYFGTGSLLSQADVTNEAMNLTRQTVYGIWDGFLEDCESGVVSPCVPDDDAEGTLIEQTLTDVTAVWNESSRMVRVIQKVPENQPDWTAGGNLGWKVDLPRAGERLVSRPQIRAGRLQFVTTNPTVLSDFAPGDGSWILQLSLESGGSVKPPGPLYDLDRSGVLDPGDGALLMVDINDTPTETLIYPLGLNLGAGNIAEPSFARVIQDIDAVFINAFILPVPVNRAELPFGGDIDVTTDSPAGPLVNPHLIDPTYPDVDRSPPAARGAMNKHLDQDGLGNRLDAHHRAYDKVHGVNYVDYFDLEPRRGKLRLDVGLLDENNNPIVVNAMQELNRVQAKQPGDIELAGLSSTQEFIVVLTNADLSQGTELQIGCRKWQAFDYQEMITTQLKQGKSPAELVDFYHGNMPAGSLVFTLNSIRASGQGCDDPTLRITVTDRVGQDGVLHATLPGCVNNTHTYRGREKAVEFPGIEDLYSVDPHVTRSGEGRGFRWRNGALTMQLLAVQGGAAAYNLQDTGLPVTKNNSTTLGNGGIFAKGFSVTEETVIVGDTTETRTVIKPETGTFPQSGLLYESSVYWNWGDMWVFQQRGQAEGCYGMPLYNAMLNNEIGGLNSAQYEGLVSELRDNQALQDEYAGLLAALELAVESGDEAEIARVLALLGQLFKTAPAVGAWPNQSLSLSDYHILRPYAHQDRFKLDLISIDLGLFDQPPGLDVVLDGTPAPVADVELDLLPAAGPNYQPGRRSWIDITPNQ